MPSDADRIKALSSSLQQVLTRHHGIVATEMIHLRRGHTNESYRIRANECSYVMRRSWAGKPAERIVREELILEALTRSPVPRIVRTLEDEPHTLDEGRAIHVFTLCEGEPGKAWLDPDDAPRARAAMMQLFELHTQLARVPVPAAIEAAGDPAFWLRERLDRVLAHDGPRLPEGAALVLRRIEQELGCLPVGPVQWLHGDYHLGNMLWRGELVVGVVDFEDTACGSAALETAMALFALSRQPGSEDEFRYEPFLWNAGLAAYREVSAHPVEIPPAAELELVFCAYQVLIHLEAAQHGLWSLDPGIGFWPCWNTLRRAR